LALGGAARNLILDEYFFPLVDQGHWNIRSIPRHVSQRYCRLNTGGLAARRSSILTLGYRLVFLGGASGVSRVLGSGLTTEHANILTLRGICEM
jgi:hypothetical protein